MKFEIGENKNAKAFIVYGIIDSCEKTTAATFYYDFGINRDKILLYAEEYIKELNTNQIPKP